MNVLIVEDEPNAAKRLSRMLKAIDPLIVVIDVLVSVSETIKWFQEHAAPDLVFMDVQLADGSSFAIFDQVQVQAPVVFTTAHDEFALQAFKVHAKDYLLKPILQKDLVEVIKRHRAQQVGQGELGLGMPDPFTTRFVIRYGDRIKVVLPEEIAYFYSQDKNTFLRHKNGKDLPMDQSLGQLEPQLDPKKFFRLNRQLLIQFNSIKDMHTYSKARVKVKLDPPFEHDAVVSSERAAEFKDWLSG